MTMQDDLDDLDAAMEADETDEEAAAREAAEALRSPAEVERDAKLREELVLEIPGSCLIFNGVPTECPAGPPGEPPPVPGVQRATLGTLPQGPSFGTS